MYTLYGMTGACSMAVHVVLNELNQPVKVVDVRVPQGQPKPPEFLKINPRGNVPVLIDGDIVMREGGAIISYLLDKHDSPMLPKAGKGRALALEWLMFANASVHPAYSKVFGLLGAPVDDAAKEKMLKAAYAQINKYWADVDQRLGESPYVAGGECSAADILLAVIANWGQDSFAKNFTFGPNLKRMLKAVSSRPAYQKALADENITYKAAA